MRRTIFLVAFIAQCLLFSANAANIYSPNGKISASLEGKTLKLNYNNKHVIDILVDVTGSKDTDFSLVSKITADYQMLSGKRLHCKNEANEYRLENLVLRLYNDGAAFRYEYNLKENSDIPAEHTAYIIPENTKRWMQQWTDAYEALFPLTTSYKTAPVASFSAISKSAEGWNNRWGYPSLIEAQDGVFALISEANIEKTQSASCLYNDKEVYRVVADENNAKVSGAWHTPWRVVITGHLKDIVESTLVTDVADENKLEDTSWIKPGVVSWIYWAYNHGSNDYNIIKKYVDMAAKLKLPYVLIDAEWDTMKGGKSIEDAVKYALSKDVKPIIWYNSSVGWVDGAPTPKYRLNKAEDREKEFAWCEKIGVAGVKIDFFSGDNLKNMEYCIDLLESAARHHLLVNFHGATIPRGWQRTYPNLMSTEGVYGAEWYNNVPTFTTKAACHNATLPFTRNVIGPMDYTPCAFSDSQHPHITTNAHELALTVLYESALQHLADKPESYYAQPQSVQDFFGSLPTVWDETRFISGYPGESVVIARRSKNTWYVAGINGSDIARTIPLSLSKLNIPASAKIQAFCDGTAIEKEKWNIQTLKTLPEAVNLQPRGGVVFIIRN
ncbi:MAG: glycoside hydrolase family 97 protein [Prevotella sp.]|nr:glycoside hydrolase family 97 protein [Prevotella sp.]